VRARALALWLFAAALASCAGTLSSTSLTTTAPNGAPERIPVLVSKPDAIALYPGCTAQLRRRPAAPGPHRPTAPLLILIGEKEPELADRAGRDDGREPGGVDGQHSRGDRVLRREPLAASSAA
jgi:hypothetical protein